MKKIAIMQPYFFPYLGYWQLIKEVDTFVVLDDVTFIKRGYIHKNHIISQGQPQQINLCINKASRNKLIKDLSLSPEHQWRHKLLKQIKYSYKKSPHYAEVNPLLEEIILNPESNLSKYLVNSLKKICEFLKITTSLVPTSSIYPKGELRAGARIMDICLRERSPTYVNPMGGSSLYSKEDFREKEISLEFIETGSSPSIIDYLMNFDREELQAQLNQYELK